MFKEIIFTNTFICFFFSYLTLIYKGHCMCQAQLKVLQILQNTAQNKAEEVTKLKKPCPEKRCD